MSGRQGHRTRPDDPYPGIPPGTCGYCGRSYDRATSCDYLPGDPTPDLFRAPPPLRCPPCGVAGGYPHHPHCPRAECVTCRGPFTECGGDHEAAA